MLSKGTGPYFYLPKLENHLEARLWNDVFNFAQDELKIPHGSIRATVLIETILAAFEMDEILYELRDHSAGLNCGRWDYIFSYIKKFRAHPEFVLPDRSEVTMEPHFLSSYVELLIQICHRRGIHAMGGMAAQIPIRNDAAANEQALEKVRRDKLREVQAGHDGTWVAHPGLVPVAKEIFDKYMPEPNQISSHKKWRKHRAARQAQDLIAVPKGDITEKGLRWNIDVGMQYLHSWLGGIGLRADLQPDGRCGDGGNLPRAGVAVGEVRRAPEGRQAGDGRHGEGDHPSARGGVGRKQQRRKAAAGGQSPRRVDDETGVCGVFDACQL